MQSLWALRARYFFSHSPVFLFLRVPFGQRLRSVAFFTGDFFFVIFADFTFISGDASFDNFFISTRFKAFLSLLHNGQRFMRPSLTQPS